MNPDLKKLIRIQAIDLAIQELRDKIAAFPAKSRSLDEKLSRALAGVEKAKEAIKANQTRRRELETRIQDTEAKVSKYKGQLMSVKTNDEYKAMVKEIEYNQQSIREEEDRVLALMEDSERLDNTLVAAQAQLAEDRGMVEAERSGLEAENAKEAGALEAYVQERAALEKEITLEVLARYDRVRRARGGIGIAPASHEACVVCNVRMRPQVFQEVRRNDSIIACDSCSRILYDPENLDHPFEVA